MYLVAAKNRHSTEILDGVQALDDCLLPRQPERTPSQIRIDNGREHLWNEADSHADTEQGGTSPVSRYLTGNDEDLYAAIKSWSVHRTNIFCRTVLTIVTMISVKTTIM